MENSDFDLKPKKIVRFIAADGMQCETYGAAQKRNSFLRLAADIQGYIAVGKEIQLDSESLAAFLLGKYTISKKQKGTGSDE